MKREQRQPAGPTCEDPETCRVLVRRDGSLAQWADAPRYTMQCTRPRGTGNYCTEHAALFRKPQ